MKTTVAKDSTPLPSTPPQKPVSSIVYLIPCPLSEGVTETIPAYVLDAVKQCQVFFVENERTARRFLKSIWKEMVIENYQWHTIHKAEKEILSELGSAIKSKKIIGIMSEAGCPGIADPGQILVNRAQQMGAQVKPLVGPSSILMALIASGLNGQQFRFHGYLPIEAVKRRVALQHLDELAQKTGETQIFIETPYRNDHLVGDILKTCRPYTKLCIAVDITGRAESIRTQKIEDWKLANPVLQKQQAIFLLGV